MIDENYIISFTDKILVTGSNGFIGTRVVEVLLNNGFLNLRCLVRPSSDLTALNTVIDSYPMARVDVVMGNLLSQYICDEIVEGVRVIYHLAAGRGDKSFANAYLNSVVTTKNLLNSAEKHHFLTRFVNVSSFSVYSNWKLHRGEILDERCDIETDPVSRGDAYCYAKVRQEDITIELCSKSNFPYVMVRPGVVYGPGNKGIHGRVGIGTFGVFLHLGGDNRIPLTYVDNCADAIVLAGLRKGVDGEVFNVVDDDLPTSRWFLNRYKKNVKNFRSLFVPYRVFYQFCHLWEKYAKWSEGQLPPVFNRKMCSIYWKGNRYSNEKIKNMLGWKPRVSLDEALMNYYEYQRTTGVRK